MRNLGPEQDPNTARISGTEGELEIDFRKIRRDAQRWKEDRGKLQCQVRQAIGAVDLRVREPS